MYCTFNRNKQKVEFREVENLNRVIQSYSMVPYEPEEMCTSSSSPSTILYQDVSQRTHKIRWLDCSTLPPKPAGEITTSYDGACIWPMCCVNDMVVVTGCGDGIFAYDARSGELKWRVEGKLEGMSQELVACGVATDKRGHLFVGDQHNIQVFSLDGRYMGPLATGTSLGEPWGVIWCEDLSSLVVLYEIMNEMKISVIKIS